MNFCVAPLNKSHVCVMQGNTGIIYIPQMCTAEKGAYRLREGSWLLADLDHNCRTKAETGHPCTQLHFVRVLMGHICFLGPEVLEE